MSDITLCRDEYCPVKDNCKRYRRGNTAYYFMTSPRIVGADEESTCHMYISKGHIAPEGVK